MEEKTITSIGNYEGIEMFRKVPEGVLYKAIDANSANRVLLKIYYPSLVWSEDLLNEFFNLISYLRFIEHDNLLPILDVGKHEGLPYVVFPDDPATFLKDRQNPVSSRKELLAFFHQMADALDFLHKQEILHGALNTENILVDADGKPRIFDYGLSGVFKKLLLENLEEGFENLSVSDLKCTSPEQVVGRAPTRQSDIYSYGVVSYFHTVGQFPFTGKSDPETAVALLDSAPVQAGSIPAHVSSDILRFIQKCIQLEPNARFASFPQVLNVLERMQAGKWVRLRSKPRLKIERRLPRRTGWIVVSVLLLLGLFTAYYSYPRTADSPPPSALTTAPNQQATSAPQTVNPVETSAPSEIEPVLVTKEAGEAEPAPATVPVSTQVEYKPAMELERPDIPSQVISLSNIGDIREYARLGYGMPEDAHASPNGQYFAVASSAGVFIFNGERYLKWIDPQDWATSVRFSTNGEILAIGLNSGDIQLWNWKDETKITTLTEHKGKISKIIFSSSDRLLYTASYDQHVIVWDLNQKSIIKNIAAHSVAVNDIAVSSDGRTLVSCADDQLIRIWDVASASKIYELRFDGKPKAVAISSDDAYFAAGGDTGFIRQWNLIDSQSFTNTIPQLRTDAIPVQKRIWSLDYIENNARLLAGIDNGESRVYNASQMEYEGISLNFAIAPPEKDLVDIFGPKFEFKSHAVLYGSNYITLRWDGRVAAQQLEIIRPMYDILYRLDFSPDGTILAAGGKRPTVNVWDLTTNEEITRSQNALPAGDPIAPDGLSMVVLTSETARITLTGEHIVEESYTQIPLQAGSSVVGELSEAIAGSSVSYARNGTVLISGNLVKSKTWDYDSGFETFSSGTPYNGCFVTSSNNDNEKLQANSPAGVLPVWDERAQNICAKSIGVNLPVFSNNLKLLAYVNSSGLVEGYDTFTKASLWRYRSQSRILALAISPDGTIVAAGDETGRLIFLNGQTGDFLTEIAGNFGTIRAIEFSDDGIKLATVGDDGTTRLFGIANPR